MAGASSTAYKLLRDLWPQTSIYEILLQTSTTIGILPKDTTFYERARYIDAGVVAPQGVGPDFAAAKASKSASEAAEFKITPVTQYGLISLEGRLLRQARNKKAVLVDPLARESRNIIQQWMRDLSAYIHGDGTGTLGTISAGSTVSTATITLTDPSTARFFYKNMWLSAFTGTTMRNGKVQVASVDPSTGNITVVGSAWNAGILDIATGDALIRYGAVPAGISGANIVSGFGGWLPASAPGGGDSWFGYNRSQNPQQSAGVIVSAQSMGAREAALYSAKEMHKTGARPDTYVLSTDDWFSLQMDLHSASALVMTKTPAAPIGKFNFGVEYDAITFMGPAGPIKAYADSDLKAGTAWMLELKTWKLASTGELCHFEDRGGVDGDDLMMEDSADSFEKRLVGDFQLYSEAPGRNGRVILA